MDISKLKIIGQKLNFIKEYSSLVVPLILVIIAGILFVSAIMMSSNLKAEVNNQSIRIGSQVKSLTNSVPSSKQWKIEEVYQKAYEADANQISQIVAQSSQRELLSYKIFPEPKETSELIFDEFGKKFCDGIQKFAEKLNAGNCPSKAEIDDHINSFKQTGTSGRQAAFSYKPGANPADIEIMVRNDLCKQKAESIGLYLDPMEIAGYQFWKEYKYQGRDEAITDCWYWQTGYWIIEDVLKTVEAMNAGSKSVFSSPVKRLKTIAFNADSTKGFTGKSSAKTGGVPFYVTSNENGITESYTGRFSNNSIDVVQFRVTVIVNAKYVMGFMKELCTSKEHKFKGLSGEDQETALKHNQITILESSAMSVDRNTVDNELYRYGDDAVMEVTVVCEYVFNKSAYDKIKPEAVKKPSSDGPKS